MKKIFFFLSNQEVSSNFPFKWQSLGESTDQTGSLNERKFLNCSFGRFLVGAHFKKNAPSFGPSTSLPTKRSITHPVNYSMNTGQGTHQLRKLSSKYFSIRKIVKTKYLTSFIDWAQKQSVQMVPVYQVAYVWRNRRGFYYIYGHDHLVHFPDYPQKVCCGLSDSLSGCSIS